MIYTDEKNLLGALKLDPALFNQLGDDLTAQFFIGQKSRIVFEAMTALRENGREISEANILEIVSVKGVDYAFLSSLSEGVPRGNTVENIRESKRRILINRLPSKLLAEAQKIAKGSGNGGEPDFTSSQEIIEQAKALSENTSTAQIPTTLTLADVEPKAVPWLWQNYIPLGRATLISGDPGSGKTWFALDMAARLSRGRSWADGAPGIEPANTYYLSLEDVMNVKHYSRPTTIKIPGSVWTSFSNPK
jgi:predicted NACHT family NTPase